MRLFGAIPLLISIFVGFLLGLITVGFLRLGPSPPEGHSSAANDGLLLGLWALAAFAMGVFLAYILLGWLI